MSACEQNIPDDHGELFMTAFIYASSHSEHPQVLPTDLILFPCYLYYDFYTGETLTCNPDVNRTKMSHKGVSLDKQETRISRYDMA